MATLVLGALGTLVGGPLGGAIGALAGREIDSQIIGTPAREGPRLKELAVTTSSYGAPVAMHFGRMRVPGTIIWATDLQESRESSGGGKGKPKTTSYSYTSSFAVALSSRPISGIGRIWADGNLLRGAAGDMKSGGQLRIHTGHGDQPVDPLMAAAIGPQCPAFRHCAYLVFEDLQLEDFGNRIPALTFEIFADAGELTASRIVDPIVPDVTANIALTGLDGVSYESGRLIDMLLVIDSLYPAVLDSGGAHLSLHSATDIPGDPVVLPQAAVAWDEGDFGTHDGHTSERDPAGLPLPNVLRYYDIARDYQPGVQRTGGRAAIGADTIIEFPGAFTPGTASALIGQAAARKKHAAEIVRWRVADLNPAITPGAHVRIPDRPGIWTVTEWEWRERGIELALRRHLAGRAHADTSDSGTPAVPPDQLPEPTNLQAFELPWDGIGSSGEPQMFAAVSAKSTAWAGAALYAEDGNALLPLGNSGRAQAVMGQLAAPLEPSMALLFETESVIDIETQSPDMTFVPQPQSELANGRNRLLIGDEIVQFAHVTQISDSRWRLRGLLRGRGGTERIARMDHPAGTPVILLGEGLVRLESAVSQSPAGARIAAIGRGDPDPVFASIRNRGASRRPLMPVHGRFLQLEDGDLALCWTRRARGAWQWLGGIATPLNEETELYRIGIGNPENPDHVWETPIPQFTLPAAFAADHPGASVWVRQVGRFDQSDPLLVCTLT